MDGGFQDYDGDFEDLDDGDGFWQDNSSREKTSILIDKLENGEMDKVISS